MRHSGPLTAAALCAFLIGCGSEGTRNTGNNPAPSQAQLAPPRPASSMARATKPLLKGLPTAAKPDVPPPVDVAQFDSADVVRRLNVLRDMGKQPPLSFNPILTRVAQDHAKLMAKEKRPDVNPATAVAEQVIEAGYKYQSLGLSQQAQRQLTSVTIYDSMINGQKLGERLVKPEYQDIGFGVDVDTNGTYYVAIIYAGVQK